MTPNDRLDLLFAFLSDVNSIEHHIKRRILPLLNKEIHFSQFRVLHALAQMRDGLTPSYLAE